MEERPLRLTQVMRRPRWIALLLLALLVAAIFAALGRWQLERAVTSQTPTDSQTEVQLPLDQVAVPQSPVLQSQVGQRVEAGGSFAPDDFSVIADRLNGGQSGYWVVGRFEVDGAAAPSESSVAVALGWTDSLDAAQRAASQAGVVLGGVTDVTGRYAGTEAPVAPGTGSAADDIPTAMSVAAFVNSWADFPSDSDVYGGYIIQSDAPLGLGTIQAGAPEQAVELNWLNVFYAVEWAVFAGFAVFLWYRLARDAWERERDAGLESEDGSGTEKG